MASGQGNVMTNVPQVSETTYELNDGNVGSNTKHLSSANRPGSSRATPNLLIIQDKNPEKKAIREIHMNARDKKSEDDKELSEIVGLVKNDLLPTHQIPSSRQPYSMEEALTNKIKGVQNKKRTFDGKFTFQIQSIKNHIGSRMIRKRNSTCKHVNLESFIRKSNTEHYIFTTLMSNLINNINRMTFNEKRSKVVSKQAFRKFPQKNSSVKKSKNWHRVEERIFPDYISEQDVVSGLRDGNLVKGFVRINPKNSQDSYVSNNDSSKGDYYLTSVIDRNRALEGDEVVLQIKPENKWIDGKITVQVVHITQKVHSRLAVGVLKPQNSDYAIFHPRDKRLPPIRIPESNWPNGFKDNPRNYANILCMAKMLQWTVPQYASGVLTEDLGPAGDLRIETLSILKEYCLDTTPFGEVIKEYLPQSHDIPKKEIERREDIRTECVFTIDPATARDLDDAVSVKILPSGNYDVGVHISDVSYYLEQGTELDQMVCKKATTIYMVDSVYHMLPAELCSHCSLLPGDDKLTFSVFWEISKQGDILSRRYARTIINSCSKLAYEHVQEIIDNPNRKFSNDDFPQIYNSFQSKDIVNTVNILQNIAVKLREKRIMNGALKIDQVKLQFCLDGVSGEPVDYSKYENKESHRLIEEFMLLANISVAEKIYNAFPEIAFLRCHEQPKQTMLVDLQNSLATYGIHIDISSSSGIRSSLSKYISNDFSGLCQAAVMNHLIAKAMIRAKYFCAANNDSDSFHHYALSVPIYTHFTSPIRRYADVMVHRLLAASLGYQDPPDWNESYISGVASNCNVQKYNAKRAGEASMDLYLAHYIQNHQPYEQDCVVFDVKERNFDVIVLKTGSIVRIYPNNCEQGAQWKIEDITHGSVLPGSRNKVSGESTRKQLRLTITFPKTKHFPRSKITVEMFSIVKVNLEKKQNSYKLEGTLVRFLPGRVFTRQQ